MLVVHNTAKYLPQCLESISTQGDSDFEIIAVDDASSDNSLDLLRQHAVCDTRMSIVRLETNGGAGPARNAGVERARGEYIWFVDSDDWVAADALSKITAALANRPDVLLFGWERVFPDGTVVPCPALNKLSSAPAKFVLHEWPNAVGILHTPWNKAVRRELLARTKYRFSPGWYQDVTFTYLMLAAASSISTLPETIVHYRQHAAAAMRTRSRGHLAVLAQWATVFDQIAAHNPHPEAFRRHLFDRMSWHLLQIAKKEDRLTEDAWPEFGAGVRRLWQAHVPAGYRFPPGQLGLELRMLKAGHVGIRLLRALSAIYQRARLSVGLASSRTTLSEPADAAFGGRTTRAVPKP
ncbi:MAG TPA: glycosyltransferase [Sphingomicrobium sp.]|nr:glycosyltransferase [Sphingomicrobium sp.]